MPGPPDRGTGGRRPRAPPASIDKGEVSVSLASAKCPFSLSYTFIPNNRSCRHMWNERLPQDLHRCRKTASGLRWDS